MKVLAAFLLFFAFLSAGYADQLENLTGSASLLRSGETVTETQLDFSARSAGAALKLLPAHAGLAGFVSAVISDLQPSIAVETLSLYKKPGSSGIAWEAQERSGLFNQILAISTLTGIQYYSTTRNSMRTLYEFSAVIDGPQTRKILPDPVFQQPPQSLTLYARQKDLTFGDNVYRFDFETFNDAFFFLQENITALNYGIIPAVGKNKLRTVMAVIDCGDSLLVYALSMAKAASFPGMNDRVSNSFRTRAEAVLGWFAGRAKNVY
ncbi:MAG: hypothetical protein LBH16_12595 [Treponema sp.]|jgi:hypothetical protein|nr:hypothetical protein [Treponema sp.]